MAGIEVLLSQYGIPLLFLIFVLEGAMLLYFAPSESLVPVAIMVIGKDLASLSMILLVSVAGATLGQSVLFHVSRTRGRDFIFENRFFRIGEAQLERFESLFQSYGHWGVLGTNSALFVRGTMTIPAGLSDMDYRKFLIYSASGTLIFEVLLAAATLGITPHI